MQQRRVFCGEAVGVLKITTSSHTWLAADAILAEREILQEEVNKGKFLKLQGRTPLPLVSTRGGRHFKPKQRIKDNSFVV